MKQKIALYPGTFDPITNGHLDIVKRVSRIFDRVIVAIAESAHKNPLLSLEQRYEIAEKSLREMDGVECITFTGLLVEEFKKNKVDVVIRGLRAISDFEYELMITLMNRKLEPDFETVFLMPSEQYIYLHSSLVKEIYRMGGRIDCHVPEPVKEGLNKWFPRS